MMRSLQVNSQRAAGIVATTVLSLTVLGSFVACGHSGAPSTGNAGISAEQAAAEMSLVSLDEVKKKVASQSGKVVVLNLWALW